MRAVRLRRYGGPEVLRVEDADPPLPGPQEIVIKVEAASVNPYDGKVRQGRFDAGPDPAGPVVPGVDAAGVIESVGAAVRGWQPGTAVFGLGRGT
ncbi:MAG TPA: alcohol dehydrogenase catalytic domain-containing protein, partial [Microlunatus sp.]|nr:alcohol dehydrogenase catalytic domain-containing protein [Microlunatus sp.]